VRNSLWLVVMAMTAAALAGVYWYLSSDQEPSVTGVLYTFPSSDRLVEIHITNPHGSVTFTRVDDKWNITEPGSYRANQKKANVMESLLLNLPIKRVLDSELPEYGFDDPQATIEIFSASGIRKVFFVANLTASKAQVYLKDSESGKVFVCDLGTVTQFDGSLDSYREKDVFSVDKSNIVQFSYFLDGEKQLTVERINGQDWQLVFPYQAPARKIQINEFLIKLRKWTAIAYPSSSEVNYQDMGLDAPGHVLEVMDANGETQRLEFGTVAAGMVFVRTGSQEDVAGIFAIDVDFSPLNATNLLFFAPLHTSIDRVSKIQIISRNGNTIFDLDQSTQPPRITSNSKEIPYEAFVSFFVKYLSLSADGYESVTKPGEETLLFKTTYLDGQTTEVRLLERDADSFYLQVDGQTGFYLSNKKVDMLLDRLNAAIGASR
jgi:hypothetical protein